MIFGKKIEFSSQTFVEVYSNLLDFKKCGEIKHFFNLGNFVTLSCLRKFVAKVRLGENHEHSEM